MPLTTSNNSLFSPLPQSRLHSDPRFSTARKDSTSGPTDGLPQCPDESQEALIHYCCVYLESATVGKDWLAPAILTVPQAVPLIIRRLVGCSGLTAAHLQVSTNLCIRGARANRWPRQAAPALADPRGFRRRNTRTMHSQTASLQRPRRSSRATMMHPVPHD
ncbi:hypothetical protein EJ02DRAFT_55549 [Clathrospora elynae]|uniref:Uncharacterized protein n=1 Tax=Clathrospora elynae TaxID=706981 RepID=A0A6A5SJC9_9PLEO|nr:hypothetical protein EJ02DRAFT_55549 [Clathrospora elynae]